jgi:hypothetical protein
VYLLKPKTQSRKKEQHRDVNQVETKIYSLIHETQVKNRQNSCQAPKNSKASAIIAYL